MNTTESHFLNSQAVTLRIDSELPLFKTDKDLLLAQAFVPGARLLDEAPREDTNLSLQIMEDDTCRVENRNGDLIYYDSWDNDMPLHMVHLLYSLIQRQHLRRNNFSVHSACATKDDRGYLFVGHSGSGKTTSALEMVRDHQFKWYSGNKTIVNFGNPNADPQQASLHAVAGTRPVTLEATNSTLDDAILKSAIRVPFVDRELRVLDDSYIFNESSVAISGIFLVRVNSGARKYERLSPTGATIPLYPYFYDYFNTDIHLPGGEMFNPGYVDDTHRNNLKKMLENALQTIPVYQVSGSFEYMADKVQETASER